MGAGPAREREQSSHKSRFVAALGGELSQEHRDRVWAFWKKISDSEE